MSTPLVSVVINCYNGESFLKEAVNSVLRQTYLNWEIIFWDNCSIDGSANIILSYNDGRIKYFKSERNTSLGQARNLALEKAKGDFIAFLDVDDIWMDDKLEKQISILLSDERIGLVYSRFLHFNGKMFFFSDGGKFNSYVDFHTFIVHYNVGMSSAIVRKSIVDRYNLMFNQKYSLIEDFDFFVKIAIYSKVFYISEILMKYRLHSDNLTIISSQWMGEFKQFLNEFKLIADGKIDMKEYELCNKWIEITAINYELMYLLKQKKRVKAFTFVLSKLRTSSRMVLLFFPVMIGYDNYLHIKSFLINRNIHYKKILKWR
uniref:glycosyltransferase family 2 protein n=1 Tax=uncultured Bacteroides sp. TaxID=162156 RepID=UPI00280BC2EA|nr:glycosyltransferase [uncultured Bacteroides sp.]